MDTQIILIGALVAVVVAVTVIVLLRRGRGSAPATPNALAKTAGPLGSALRRAWSSGVDDSTWSELEEALVAADVGVQTSAEIVADVRKARPTAPPEARAELRRQLIARFENKDRALAEPGAPSVILLVGVNGTGKTTTIAKLGRRLAGEGAGVVFAAADTFRAAAGDQLRTWADRVGVDVIGGQAGGDPASIVFDAIAAARSRGAAYVLVDTAGRLQAKKNLMAELSKIHRVAAGGKEKVEEVLLVMDATGGQNGISQAEEFSNAVPLTGIVLTKLDGTAKGGIVVAVERQLGIPVKFVGLGEGPDDLEAFDPNRFVDDLLEET